MNVSFAYLSVQHHVSVIVKQLRLEHSAKESENADSFLFVCALVNLRILHEPPGRCRGRIWRHSVANNASLNFILYINDFLLAHVWQNGCKYKILI